MHEKTYNYNDFDMSFGSSYTNLKNIIQLHFHNLKNIYFFKF